MPIKTFRGKLADDTQDTINLHTNNGLVGYRIKKFQLVSDKPGIGGNAEAICKIYTQQQTAIDGLVDFSDTTLLAVAILAQSSDSWISYDTVVFDQMVFNQDVFVTFTDEQGNMAGNYYIEMEQVMLDLNEATVATLQDIRNIG
jgi:hypothetical protein